MPLTKTIKIFALATMLLQIIGNEAFANSETTTLKAKKVENIDDGNVIIAIDNVEAVRGGITLKANKIVYDKAAQEIKTESEVVIKDTEKKNLFLSERAKVSDDLKKATFYNGGIVFENGSHMLSPYIQRFEDKNFQLFDVKYFSCPSDAFNMDMTYNEIMNTIDSKKSHLFSVTSHEINSDIAQEKIELRGSVVWLWKIPVFYLPYIKSKYIFDKDANGFRFPGIEKSSYYGYGVYLPYYYKTTTQSIRLAPKIYQRGNYLLNAKYSNFRDIENELFHFEGDITNDNNQSKNLSNAYGLTEENEGYKQWRGYGKIDGYKNFSDVWHFDYLGYIASDRYYLRDYTRENPNYFESNFSLSAVNNENPKSFNYMIFDNLFYQDLLEKSVYKNARYAPTLNIKNQNIIYKSKSNNLFYDIKGNATGLYRANGLNYNRATIKPSINNTYNNRYLGTINANLNLKGEVYLLNNTLDDDGDFSRVVPEFDLEYRKTLSLGRFYIQPIVKYTVSPNSKSFEENIPNEDSRFSELSFINIFSTNRFNGHDRTEYGNRISYGFESGYENISFGIAQGHRDVKYDSDQEIIGFEENLSDYVGYASYNISNNLDLYYRFRLNRNDFSAEFNEIDLNFNYKNLAFYGGYIYMKPNFLYYEKQNQVNFGGNIWLYNRWNFNFGAILDVQNGGRFLEKRIGLDYDGGCTMWSISYSDYKPLTKTERSTSWNFSFQLKFL